MPGSELPTDTTTCLSCGLPVMPETPVVPADVAPPIEPVDVPAPDLELGAGEVDAAGVGAPDAPPTTAEAAAGEPAAEEPVTEEPVAGEPGTGESGTGEPGTEGPVAGEPVTEGTEPEPGPSVPSPSAEPDDGPAPPSWAVDEPLATLEPPPPPAVLDASDETTETPAPAFVPTLPPPPPPPPPAQVASAQAADEPLAWTAQPEVAPAPPPFAAAAPVAPAELPPTVAPTVCPHCGVTLAMAPPDDVPDGAIAVGFIGSGRGSRAAIAVADPHGGATLFTENGVSRHITGRHLRHFTPVRGLGSMTSRIAAALVALEHLPVPALTASDSARTSLVSTLVDGRVEVARRVAADLATAGVSAPIAGLPLSASEVNWWSALADVRVQRFDAAIGHLAALPEGAYPAAVGVLVLCTGAPIAATSRRARTALEHRLLAVEPSSALAGAAAIAGKRSALIDWLEHPEPFGAIAALPVEVPSVSIDLLRHVAGVGDRAEPVVVPAKTPMSIVDDLLDHGFRIAETSLRQFDRDRIAYVTARTDPTKLTDEEVDVLHVESEHDRRTLLAGRIPDPTADRPDSALIGGIRRLVTSYQASDVLREVAGPMADLLAAFLATPAPERLDNRITDDESVWGLLERVLPDEALGWDAPIGGSARRFLTWWAMRRAQRALWAADWEGALACAKQAVRLADHPAPRAESNNFVAVANWMLGRDGPARDALLAAVTEVDVPGLRTNLGIVNAAEMFAARRHPYLVLGIPTSADRDAAERAFAQRSRLARRDHEFPHTVDDLVWALNQVEQLIDDLSMPPVLRVPIDPRLLQAPTGHGLFRPRPVPLPRRTPAPSPAELGALIADARSDVLLHVLKGAGFEARRSLGVGRDAPPPRPLPLETYPHQRQTRLPQYLLGAVVVAGGVVAGVVFVNRHRNDTKQAESTVVTTTVAATTTSTTEAPTTSPTTTIPPLPGFGQSITVNGTTITPHAPLTGYAHLCVLFDLAGSGPLGFVPSEVELVNGAKTTKLDEKVTTGRGKNTPVFGEKGSAQRELCWLAPDDWEKNTTDLVYTLNGKEYRWRISDPS